MKRERPKILCLTAHSPLGPDYGARLRARHIVRLLNRVGQVRVALVGPYEQTAAKSDETDNFLDPADVFEFEPQKVTGLGERLRRELNPRFLNTHGVTVAKSQRDKLMTLVAEHDLVWVHGVRVANSLGIWRWPHSVLDVDDVSSGIHKSAFWGASSLGEKLRNLRQAVLWRRRERVMIERFDAVAVCSETDRRQLGGSGKIFVVPNGFDAPTTLPVRMPASPSRIGFLGTLQYAPNVEGLRWFMEKAWPLVCAAMPDARLRLVGQASDAAAWCRHENVDGLGFVADADAEMATWALTIVPLFVGGGTRVKIATAFSRKCPVVSTALGAFGYEVSHGRELLLADTPQDFASACLRLLREKGLAECLAENAWNAFTKKWSWEAIAPRITSVAEFALQRREFSDAEMARDKVTVPVSASA